MSFPFVLLCFLEPAQGKVFLSTADFVLLMEIAAWWYLFNVLTSQGLAGEHVTAMSINGQGAFIPSTFISMCAVGPSERGDGLNGDEAVLPLRNSM
jgi:hypothetical protein